MLKGDGHLSHDLDPLDQGPKDACGVFGVWAPGEDVSKLTYYGLYALQHRGQESAGIAVSEGSRILVYKDMGLVAQVFDESILGTLKGHLAIGHCRYSTTGSSVWENAQPTLSSTDVGGLALAHNGNLINTGELAERVAPGTLRATTDSEILTAILAKDRDEPIDEAAARLLPMVRGAYSLVFMDEKTLYAARDPRASVRSSWAGWSAAGWWPRRRPPSTSSARRSCARSSRASSSPSTSAGSPSRRFAAGRPQGLPVRIRLPGPPRHHDRRAWRPGDPGRGRPPAGPRTPGRRRPGDPDPESGTPAAIGYAEQSGIPYGQGLVKNSYVGRTFIQPSQTIRQLGIRLKLNPLKEIVQGKRLIVVDDTIVRGNTQRAIVKMLREAGATEVHVRISAPPVAWPCFYGIDFATRAELLAGSMDVEEIREHLGADSLGYISMEGLDRGHHDPGEQALPSLLRRHLPHPDRPGQGRQVRPGGPRMTSYAAAGVDIEAGDRAVELMKSKVARSRRPEVVDDASGFAGLFDVSALLKFRAAADGDLDRRGRHQGHAGLQAGQARHDRHRPGRHGRRRPGGLRGRAALHDRLHRLRQGRARAHRRDRRRRRRGLPPGGLRPGRRRDRRTPGRDGPRRLRPGRRRDGRRGGRRAPGPRPGPRG